MRKTILFSALLVAAATVTAGVGALSAQDNPFLGRWNITGTGPDSGKVYFLEVRQEGDSLAGLFLDRGGHATPVSWIKVANGELQWQHGGGGETLPKPACGPLYRARIEGGKLIGQHETPGTPCPPRGGAAAAAKAAPKAPPRPAPAPQTVHWVGVRQPVWPPSNANGTHTYGPPVVIVGPGVGKEVWTGLTPETSRTPCVDRWTMADGVMTNDMPARGERSTCNPYTKQRFSDFRIEAEFNLDEGQNSGLYLRGRYELQLMLQRPGQPPAVYPGRLMDIYGWKRADVYAGNPPGEWQVLDAVVVGNRITATLNGKKVHDNAVLAAFTGGALDNDELSPGPIMIQGDHSRVSFRKLVVTPITRAGQ
jgi:hypothetical protein